MIVDEGRMLNSRMQRVSLEKRWNNKKILDIGGGGEGIIGKLYGADVIAIDHKKKELIETENDAIKLVMNAEDMPFLNKQFDVVTLFFTLMYMGPSQQKACLKEAVRVLKPGGILQIWDSNLPPIQGVKDIFVLQLEIDLPDEIITTGYGVLLGELAEDIETVLKRASGLGLKVKAHNKLSEKLFYLELEKVY